MADTIVWCNSSLTLTNVLCRFTNAENPTESSRKEYDFVDFIKPDTSTLAPSSGDLMLHKAHCYELTTEDGMLELVCSKDKSILDTAKELQNEGKEVQILF